MGGVLSTFGCNSRGDPLLEAAVFAVGDVLTHMPDDGARYLSPSWQLPETGALEDMPPELLARLQNATRLPVAPAGLMTSGDSTMIVLYLFRPVVVRPDSILVLAGWMNPVGGDGGGAWGVEYDYRLDCRRECQVSTKPGESHWN